LQGLQKNSLLNDEAKVYVESESELDENELSDYWQVMKAKTAGKVYYYLLGLNDDL